MSSSSSKVSILIYLGAGQATELETWVEQGFESIVLVEPHPVLANKLRFRSRNFPQVKVLESAVTTKAELSELRDYTISGLASLREPTGLQQVFPGLQLAQCYAVATSNLAQIVNHYGPSPEQKAHLIIAAAGEEADLVDSLLRSDQLERFLSVSLKASIEPLYEGAEPASHLVKRLEDAGYELKNAKAIDSDWGEWLLQRDPLKDQLAQAQSAQKRAETLQSQLEKEKAELAKQNSVLKAAVQANAQILQEAKEQLVEQDNQQDDLVHEIKKIKEELNDQKEQAVQKIANLHNDLSRAQADSEQKSQELEKLQAALQSTEEELKKEQEKTLRLSQENALLVKTQTTAEVGFAQLEERMNQLFSQQATQIQQATHALGKHVTHSFLQQRQHYQSVLGLQHYLESGEQPLAFGGWAIGADMASHLVQLLERHSYDLIIEFGSGTSTALMAKVIQQQIQRHSTTHIEDLQLTHQSADAPALKTRTQARPPVQSLESYELPRRILSFEQDKTHFQQTKQRLASQGLHDFVDLVLAPLVPSRFGQHADRTALFYDCDHHLARIAPLFENSTARILVLVDGPFSPKSDPLVRAPALAQVLQYFSSKHLDIVLDDSARDGEQQVVQHWRELCAERGLQWQEKELEADKGALWITVTP